MDNISEILSDIQQRMIRVEVVMHEISIYLIRAYDSGCLYSTSCKGQHLSAKYIVACCVTIHWRQLMNSAWDVLESALQNSGESMNISSLFWLKQS